MKAEVELSTPRYTSNWVVANCNYYLLLGMPRNFEVQPTSEYNSKEVTVIVQLLISRECRSDCISVSNLGVKKFRSLLREKKSGHDFVVLQISNISQNSDE